MPAKKKPRKSKKKKNRKGRKPGKRKVFWKAEKFLVFVGAVFLVAFLSFAAMAIVEFVNTSEYVEADIIRVIDTTVVLGNNCTAIVAETSPERAASIQLGIDKKIEVRPNTHDIFADVLKSFNITLQSVTIDRFEEGIYYATLHLSTGEETLMLDSKPSDAIAIALRTDSPVYIRRGVLKDQGQNICK